MKRSQILVALSILSALLVACGGQTGGLEEEPLGTAKGALEQNALVPNALVPNALLPEALAPNSLVPRALNPDSLDPSDLEAIQDPGTAGELSRMFMRYTVGCALDPSQSFEFSWTDNESVVHDEAYWGELGLAPSWSGDSIGEDSQRWVSACLAARANYYGTVVTISMRAPGVIDKAGTPELETYPEEEGAFWGNIFSSTPSLRACNKAANIDNSRATHRDCAAGHLDGGNVTECGLIHIIGSCDTWCDPLNEFGKYWPSCTDDPAVSTTASNDHVVSVFLPTY